MNGFQMSVVTEEGSNEMDPNEDAKDEAKKESAEEPQPREAKEDTEYSPPDIEVVDAGEVALREYH